MAQSTFADALAWVESVHPDLDPLRKTEHAQKLLSFTEMIDGELSVDAHNAVASELNGQRLPTRLTNSAFVTAAALRELIDRGVVRGISLADGADTGTELVDITPPEE